MTIKSSIVCGLCALALFVAFFFLVRDIVPTAPYSYDEADYMHIAKRGFLSHWIDSPSQSLIEFLHAGLGRGTKSENRTALSEEIRGSDDINFYRHWHGPLYEDWIMSVAARWKTNEQSTRRTTLFFHLATFGVILAGCWLLRGPWIGFFCAAIYLLSFSNSRTAVSVGPHALYVFCYIGALLSMMLWMETHRPRFWYASLIFSALAFCTLEVGVILVVVLIVTAWLERKHFGDWHRPQWIRFAIQSASIFITTILLVWPAAILKLSFLKAWGFMAYLAFFRRAAWGSDSTLESWKQRIEAAPLDWAILFIGVLLGVLWLARRPAGRVLIPVFVYSALMIVALLRVASDETRYIAPYLPALQLIAGLAFAALLSDLATAWRWPSAIALFGLVVAANLPQFRTHIAPPASASESHRALLDFVTANHLESRKLLIPKGDAPMLHYYFPNLAMKPYAGDDLLRRYMTEEQFDGLLYEGDFPKWLARDASSARYVRARHVSKDESSGLDTFYMDLPVPASPENK